MLTSYEKDLLYYLFYGRVDLQLVQSDDFEFFANISNTVSKKERFEIINTLKKMGYIAIYGKDFKKINEDIHYDTNIHKSQYFLAITEKGGDYIFKEYNKSWDKVLDYYISYFKDRNYLKVELIMHKKIVVEIKKILNNFNILLYNESYLDYWYPFYWKRLKSGYKIEFVIKEKLFEEKLEGILDEYRLQ